MALPKLKNFTPTFYLASAALATSAVAIYLQRRYFERRRLRLGNFPHSSPWFLPLADLSHVIRAGSFPKFVTNRKKRLGCDNFYIHLYGFTRRPTLVITKPEDQVEIMRKEGKMQLYVEFPEEPLHGPGNMQVISGKRHQFLRKIFSSLLSPVALEGFVPIIVGRFRDMWADMERRSKESEVGGEAMIGIQEAICDAQFLLMTEVFFGIKPDTEEEKANLAWLRTDFELQLEGHFLPPKSDGFQKALAASKHIHQFLMERFAKVLESRRKIVGIGLKGSSITKKDDVLPPIGNAMESIADALLRDGVADDPQVLSDVGNNLNLLLEASHGTTMTVTTTTMYFLNRSKGVQVLEKLRKEVSGMEGDGPTYTALKDNMPYGEACIMEAMRLAPIVGGVTYVMDDDLDVTFKGQKLVGPMSFNLNFSHNYRDGSIFPEPEVYIPERWVAGSEDEASERAKIAYRPFGMGRHLCLGYKLAILVMKASLHCFATDPRRTIEFDEKMVMIEDGLFPERKVKDGFPGRVVVK